MAHFKIITAAYNCKDWVVNNLEALKKQNHKDWQGVYIDDCSSDGGDNIAQELIRRYKLNVKFIRNTQRKGALYNQIYAIEQSCPKDEDVIVIVDGDDWFKDECSLSAVNSIYQSPDVWMTYGNYEDKSKGRKGGVCIPIPNGYNPRNGRWLFSHLRTFKFFLYKNLDRRDFRFTDTNIIYTSTGDCAIMRPLAEIATREHIKFIDKILLVYNNNNPIGDGKIHRELQAKCGADISAKPCYSPKTKQQLLEKQYASFL